MRLSARLLVDWLAVRVGVLLEQCLNRVPGGTGRYSRQIAAALARTADAQSSVYGWTAAHRDVAGARIAGVDGPHSLRLPRRVLSAAYERGLGPSPRRVDVVHAPTPLMPPRRRTPVVVTIHDAVPWTHPETLTTRGAAWHRRMAERAARDADAIVVVTHAVVDELNRCLDLDPQRVHVIGGGVSSSLAAPADADRRAERLGLPRDYFLAVGTLEPRKGLTVALDALASRDSPDLPLLVVGPSGWGGLDVATEAASRGLDDRAVRVLGHLDDADLATAMSRATALVMPSRSEGFGLPMLEAMALGTATITTDVPALVEVAGGAAMHVPVGDSDALAGAMARIVHDDELRAGLATRGPARAAHYSWDAAAESLWVLYRRLVG